MNPYKIISVDKSVADDAVELLTRQQVKDWLRITFTDDDTVIDEIIQESRQELEELCSISLVDSSMTVEADLEPANNRTCIEFELPYGPVKDVDEITVELWNGSSWDVKASGDDYNFFGVGYLKFHSPFAGIYRFTYETGYTKLPPGLRGAWRSDIAHRYENRGDEDKQGMSDIAKAKAQPFKRFTWL
jgi:hypothetical protein